MPQPTNVLVSVSLPEGHGVVYDLTIGIAANILFAAIVLLFLFLLQVVLRRHQLHEFFGISKEKILRIFIGHIPHPSIPMGLVGFEESSVARNLASLFQTLVPGLSEKPGFLRYLRFGDVDVQVEAASEQSSTVNLNHSVISLGGKSNNRASKLIESEGGCPVKLAGEITIPGLPPITSGTQAVIVRICKGEKTFFYLAGLDEPGTATAGRFLEKNWREMRKQYGPTVSFYYLIERVGSSETKIVAHQRLHVTA